jgi:hypothetical protein
MPRSGAASCRHNPMTRASSIPASSSSRGPSAFSPSRWSRASTASRRAAGWSSGARSSRAKRCRAHGRRPAAQRPAAAYAGAAGHRGVKESARRRSGQTAPGQPVATAPGGSPLFCARERRARARQLHAADERVAVRSWLPLGTEETGHGFSPVVWLFIGHRLFVACVVARAFPWSPSSQTILKSIRFRLQCCHAWPGTTRGCAGFLLPRSPGLLDRSDRDNRAGSIPPAATGVPISVSAPVLALMV